MLLHSPWERRSRAGTLALASGIAYVSGTPVLACKCKVIWMLLVRCVRLVVVGLLLVVPAAAWGQPALTVGISYGIDSDGSGLLEASTYPYGGATISWRLCPGGGSVCTPVSGSANDGQLLDVGDAPAGTVFEVTAIRDGQSASARSVPYLGRMSAAAGPGLTGALRVGALVRPTPASWTGGWGRDSPYLQTQVCRDRTGGECVVIADQGRWNRCPGAGAVLDRRHEGGYVRVIDRRTVFLGPHTLAGIPLPTAPEQIAPITPSPTAAAATFGPITAAIGPPESTCGRSGLPEQASRVRALRRCLSGVARHAQLEARRARSGSARQRPRARRHLTRHAASGRQRCLRRHGRTPGRVTGLNTLPMSPGWGLRLRFRAPGTEGSNPPAARRYLVKVSDRPIRSARAFARAVTLCAACRTTVVHVGDFARVPVPAPPPRTTYYYAVAARDNVSGRLGPRSRTVRVSTD